MSLPRLRELIKHHVISNYLDPAGIRIPNGILLSEPSSSSGVKKAYIHNKVLSLFFEKTNQGIQTGDALQVQQCLGSNWGYVYTNARDHDNVHLHADFEELHTHIYKGEKKVQTMSVQDVICLLNTIKENEQTLDMCRDGKANCLLSDEDQKKMIAAYEKYLEQKKALPAFEAAVDKLYNKLEKKCINGSKTFAHAFINTFINKYLKPYLINKFHTPKQVSWGLEILNGAMTYSLNNSLLNTTLDIFVHNALKPGFTALGVHVNLIDMISTEIGSVIAFAQNPLSLIELSINGTAAALGQMTAYQLIRTLPKLKYEPKEESITQINPDHHQTAAIGLPNAHMILRQ